jgi:Bacterial SH3 domain
MRIVTSALLTALILTLPLSVIAAPSLQSTIDIKTIALTRADLPRGFEMVPDRTVSEDRPDGVAVYDVTFARERTVEHLAAGPFEVRSGVARTAQVDDAVLQLESTREAFLAEGWSTTDVPPLGDETLGLTQATDGEGGKITHYSYLFRKGSYILMVGIRGRPEATNVSDVVALAIVVSGRLDKALGAGPPTSPPGGPSTPSGSATGERVRVVNPGGGSVNVRSEPSTGADVVAQVSDAATLDIVGPNREGDGRAWRNVRTSDGKNGWIASTFLETVTPPAPAPSPSPAPPGPASSAESTESAPPPDEPAEGGEAPAEPSPPPSPVPSPAASSGGSFRGTGNGLTVDGEIRETNLSAGKQLVKVHVTENGRGVANAFVDITARLDPRRYRAIKADRTNNDGWTEVEWEMEGPAGTYEVIVEVKTSEAGPVTTAKGSFKWK